MKFKNYILDLFNEKISRSEIIFVIISLLVTALLYYIPTGFENAIVEDALPAKALVIEVDNSGIHTIGIIHTGVQTMKVRIIDGDYSGIEFDTINHLIGKMEMDKIYKPGESVFSVIQISEGKPAGVKVIDRYRINMQVVLLGMFILLLVLYAGWVGIKALLSFLFSAVFIWKVLLPGYLNGISPVPLSLAVTAILISITIFLVAGFTRKGVTAFLGALSGVLLTCMLSVIFGTLFKIPGEIKPFAESLLYIGFLDMRLSDIFLSGIFIASSGALMDVTMDIAASQAELVMKHPEISKSDLIISGFRVGRTVIGTMTTTLLLAYSGGYSTMLMMFIAQGVPHMNILNIQYVSAEILNILVGSFGLVAVAPLTAIIGGFVYTAKNIYPVTD